MVGGPVGTALLVVVGVILFVIGFFELSVCGQGLSLILFGGAIFFVGLGIYPAGGPVLIGMFGLIAFLLVVVGLIFGHGAGCTF